MEREKAELLMKEALKEAEKAFHSGEVPVGCVIADASGKIVGRGHNVPLSTSDPTAHAEIIALREAGKKLSNYRLNGHFAFVTIEPCPMCAGALVAGRLEKVYFGTRDDKGGGLVSLYTIGRDGKMNHHLDVEEGILREECASMMKKFFRNKR